MNNTELWAELEKTDPKYTKPFSRGGGFKGTAINTAYIVRRLTESFGPCGKGWRFVLDDERIEEGHTLKNGDRSKVHIVRGHLSYVMGGQWYDTSPQFGQTMLVDENKYGVFTDEEAPKKSITDCIGKCAVLLGVGADVHLGLFDDNKYVNERKAESANSSKANASAGIVKGQKQDSHPDDLGATDFKAALRAFEQERIGVLMALRGKEMTAGEANDRYREIRAGAIHYEVNGTKKSAKTDALLKQCMRSDLWNDDPRSDWQGFERRLKETRDELDNALKNAGANMPDDPFTPDAEEAAE